MSLPQPHTAGLRTLSEVPSSASPTLRPRRNQHLPSSQQGLETEVRTDTESSVGLRQHFRKVTLGPVHEQGCSRAQRGACQKSSGQEAEGHLPLATAGLVPFIREATHASRIFPSHGDSEKSAHHRSVLVSVKPKHSGPCRPLPARGRKLAGLCRHWKRSQAGGRPPRRRAGLPEGRCLCPGPSPDFRATKAEGGQRLPGRPALELTKESLATFSLHSPTNFRVSLPPLWGGVTGLGPHGSWWQGSTGL